MEQYGQNGQRKRSRVLVMVMAAVLFSLSLMCWTKKEDKFSISERRVLAGFPGMTVQSLWSGEFMKEFEEYCLDQFPFRDSFRSLKAVTNYEIFRKKDNNGIYKAEGHLSKIEYPLQRRMLENAVGRMEYIYHSYLEEQKSRCYFIPVADKNLFLAKQNGYLSMDYDALFSFFQERITFAEYVDITPFLSLEDYYKTDTHWRQEKIVDIAEYLKAVLEQKMGEQLQIESIKKKAEEKLKDYTLEKLETPFYGVYHGQSALPIEPETIYYLNSEVLENCTVTSYDTGMPRESAIYTLEKAEGKDAYEIFLSGANALLVIENEMAEEEKELLVFRDSFASSLVPLLADAYSKITVIDTRYVKSDVLGKFIDFHGQDVLFLYSTLILNDSLALR